MPRGKTTKREECDASRLDRREKAEKADQRKAERERVLRTYDQSSRPTMPETKGECRLLRQALKARGDELKRVGLPANKQTLAPSGIGGSSKDRRVAKLQGGDVDAEWGT